jgi:hypothetical protein
VIHMRRSRAAYGGGGMEWEGRGGGGASIPYMHVVHVDLHSSTVPQQGLLGDVQLDHGIGEKGCQGRQGLG